MSVPNPTVPLIDCRLRVLHLVESASAREAVSDTAALVGELDAERIASFIRFLDGAAPPARAAAPSPVPVRVMGASSRRGWRSLLDLIAMLRRERIDVLHSYGWESCCYGALARFVARTPVAIHTVQDGTQATLPAWKRVMFNLLARRGAHFVVRSRSTGTDLLSHGAIRPEAVTYVPADGHPAQEAGEDRRPGPQPRSMAQTMQTLYEERAVRAKRKGMLPPQDLLKRALGLGFACSGMTALARKRNGGALTILTYHRVLPIQEARQYPFQAMVMPRDHFEAQMAHVSRHYTVLPFGDAMKLLQAAALPPRAVTVTFDDGYADNEEHAWPILAKYDIPATLFVVTGVLDRMTYLWWDAIARAVPDLINEVMRGTERQAAFPEAVREILVRASESGHLLSETQALVNVLNALSRPERERLLAQLLTPSVTEGMNDALMLTWDRLRRMHRGGWEIGAHTVTHAFVDELDEGAVREEIRGSIRRIEQELHSQVRVFSYPRGRVADHVKAVLRELRVEAAVTTELGLNEPGTPAHHLKRFDVGLCRTPGQFSSRVFDAEVNGLFQLVRRG
jgi:peptidoglycan/xylan/chitin deacetylase (PgdA/CDA1 family)